MKQGIVGFVFETEEYKSESYCGRNGRGFRTNQLQNFSKVSNFGKVIEEKRPPQLRRPSLYQRG